MFNARSAIYGLKSQARAVCAVEAEEERHAFLVGTLNRKGANEVHLLEYEEEENVIRRLGRWDHAAAGEVWAVTSSPSAAGVFATVHNAAGEGLAASVWRAPGDGDAAPAPAEAEEEAAEEKKGAAPPNAARPLELLGELGGAGGRTSAVVWGPADSSYSGALVSLHGDRARLWRIDAGGGAPVEGASSGPLAGGPPEGLLAGCWDPHHTDTFVAAQGRSLAAFDLRTMRPAQGVRDAHEGTVRDVDYNPNKPYHVVSGGEDRKVRFWDLRKADRPLRTLAKHSHWAWNVRYNRFHDQLVLSAGTDSYVNLWSIVSISSAPLGDLEDPANEREGDKLIKTYDEHEDSVYSVAWSCCDAWIFASLSYDGRLVINHVPPAEKYKILL